MNRAPATPPLRVLAVTRIFPNRVEPGAGAFQRQQLACLARRCRVEVMAVIPYLLGASLLGQRTRPGRLAALPDRCEVEGIPVVHPRAPYVPRVGALRLLAPLNAPLYLAGLLPHLPGLRGRFDVVLGTYLFPDACAAGVLATLLGLPFVVKTHGTDVNVVGRWPAVRPMIASTLRRAAWSLGVSRPMVDALVQLGAPPPRAVLLPNGVDRTIFHPRDRGAARRALDLPAEGRLIVFVGSLEKEKGLRELVAARALLEEAEVLREAVHVVVVGDGTLRGELAQAAATLRSGRTRGRIVLAGERPLEEVARYVAAGDLLALPSWAEGTPNVVLEALAVGRPVVATQVGGIPFVVDHGRTGLLVPPRDARSLAWALQEGLTRTWDERAITASAPGSWDESAAQLHGLLIRAAEGAHLEVA